MNKEPMIEKIKKMLALAANNPESEEAKTASIMAGKLMAKYEIEQSELLDIPYSEIDSLDIKTYFTSSKVRWEAILCNIVAMTFNSKAVTIGTNVRLIGAKQDLIICNWYVSHLRLVIGKKAESMYKGKLQKNSYIKGILYTLQIRFAEMMKEKEENLPANTKALVLSKNSKVEQAFKEQFPVTKQTKNSIGDQNIFRRGVDDGRNISINRPLGNSTASSINN